MSNPGVAIIEWCAWERFLLPYIATNAVRIAADPFNAESRNNIIERASAYELVCFQINLSVSYDLPIGLTQISQTLEALGCRVLNAHCQDITKAALHRVLTKCGLPSLRQIGAPEQDCMVIIKSNLNCGGTVERREFASIPRRSISAQLLRDDYGPLSYQVMCSSDVPATTYADDKLVVERFIENRDDCIYRMYFAGRNRVVVKVHGTGHIIKVNGDNRDINIAYSEEETDAAKEVLPCDVVAIGSKLPEAMRAEFGCVDIVANDDGDAYAVDFNPTPHAGTQPPPSDVVEYLRLGLFALTHSVRSRERQ